MPYAQLHHQARVPAETNAYLVGGGITSHAAVVNLIHDAHVTANQIHILESGPVPGESMDGGGTSETGYILRGGRMLNFSYLCTYDLLSKVPSLTDPAKTVKQEIDEFNAVPGKKTNAHARLVANKTWGFEITWELL
jgi:oleate hydratase